MDRLNLTIEYQEENEVCLPPSLSWNYPIHMLLPYRIWIVLTFIPFPSSKHDYINNEYINDISRADTPGSIGTNEEFPKP